MLRDVCSWSPFSGVEKFSDLLCVNYLNLAVRDRNMLLLPQGGGSGPGRREGTANSERNAGDSQKVRASIFLAPETLPCTRTCVQACKGCL